MVLLMQDSYLSHHGILGMHWGIRRYQNPDGSLTEAGRKHYDKLDTKWAKKNSGKIEAKVKRKVAKDINAYNRELSRQPGYYNANGKVSKKAINAYNRKLASLMNEKMDNIETPSGRVVRFVAKRGELGVQMALADPGYDMSKMKNGIWSSGRVAYKKKQVDKINI